MRTETEELMGGLVLFWIFETSLLSFDLLVDPIQQASSPYRILIKVSLFQSNV